MNYPGVSNKTFLLRLIDEFSKGEILNEHLIVLSTKKLDSGYLSKVTTEEDFKHKQFLYKYSQYFWGL